MEDKFMSVPAIKVFQTQHDEFLFLGKEYDLETADMKAVWDDFINSGGYEINKQYGKYPYACMIVYHNNNPEHISYCPGAIVESIDKVPEGFTLMKFPAREYLVVTTEWMETFAEAVGENGLGQTGRYLRTVEIPAGYIRYDGPGSQIVVIEVENANTENGSRWENWVPIKKIDG